MYTWSQQFETLIPVKELNTEKRMNLCMSAIEYIEEESNGGFRRVLSKHGRNYLISDEVYNQLFC